MAQTLTLKTVRETFWDKASSRALNVDAGEKLLVDGKINEVQERFITQGKWRGAIVRARFAVYNNQITLPNSLESVLKYSPVDENGGFCGEYPVWNQWHSLIATDDTGLLQPYRATDLGDGWPTFRDPPYSSFYIKAQSELAETGSPTILLRGGDVDGKVIYTAPGTEGVSLLVSVTAQTTSQVFSSLAYWVKSAVTNGVVRLWAVDTDTADETLIAIIVPGKTVSNYRRYAIPMCSGDNPVVEVIAKRGYVPARADNDPVVPSNMGALKLGLMALNLEDKPDLERANEYWQMALNLLENERQEFDGDAMPTFHFAPDFGAGNIPNYVY